MGEFDVVRKIAEKQGKGVGDHGASEKRQFNQFIFGMVLENIPVPLLGKGFTWYQPNGRSKSRIKQVSSIKEMIQCLAIMYSIHFRYEYIGSHCLILLKDSKVDWGPKPFRNLNCWFQDNGFKGFVENSWKDIEIQGWGAYVLKEKLKRLMGSLKS